MKVKYSIVVTAYNYENFIGECIDSCLNQSTRSSYEIIVVNDGSTDNTLNILNGYGNERLTILTIPNGGIERASNHAFERAQGDYIVRLDADDILHLDFLKNMDAYVSKFDADFYYPDYYIVNNNSEVTQTIELPEFNVDEIMARGDFLATGTLYSRKILKNIGFYSEKTRNSGLENYELIIKMLIKGAIGYRVAEKLFYYRRHSLNMSDVKRDRIILYGKQLFNKLGLGEFRTNENHPYQLKLT